MEETFRTVPLRNPDGPPRLEQLQHLRAITRHPFALASWPERIEVALLGLSEGGAAWFALCINTEICLILTLKKRWGIEVS